MTKFAPNLRLILEFFQTGLLVMLLLAVAAYVLLRFLMKIRFRVPIKPRWWLPFLAAMAAAFAAGWVGVGYLRAVGYLLSR